MRGARRPRQCSSHGQRATRGEPARANRPDIEQPLAKATAPRQRRRGVRRHVVARRQWRVARAGDPADAHERESAELRRDRPGPREALAVQLDARAARDAAARVGEEACRHAGVVVGGQTADPCSPREACGGARRVNACATRRRTVPGRAGSVRVWAQTASAGRADAGAIAIARRLDELACRPVSQMAHPVRPVDGRSPSRFSVGALPSGVQAPRNPGLQ